MKIYSPSFTEEPNNSPYPSKAHNWDSMRHVYMAYYDFVQTCENFGSVPAPLWIFNGECAGDEEKYGYPDFPDRIMRIGPRGGIITERA